MQKFILVCQQQPQSSC